MNIIVAMGKDGAIGKEGGLIWKIPSDLKRFKALTMGHPVIMGRKTWESLPKKPLPGRRNIILTRNENFTENNAEVVFSVEGAMNLVEGEDAFVIGGAEIYNAFLPYASRLYITLVDDECKEADAFLHIDFSDGWELEESSSEEITPDGVAYRYLTFKR